jgi:hypothetical protein
MNFINKIKRNGVKQKKLTPIILILILTACSSPSTDIGFNDLTEYEKDKNAMRKLINKKRFIQDKSSDNSHDSSSKTVLEKRLDSKKVLEKNNLKSYKVASWECDGVQQDVQQDISFNGMDYSLTYFDDNFYFWFDNSHYVLQRYEGIDNTESLRRLELFYNPASCELTYSYELTRDLVSQSTVKVQDTIYDSNNDVVFEGEFEWDGNTSTDKSKTAIYEAEFVSSGGSSEFLNDTYISTYHFDGNVFYSSKLNWDVMFLFDGLEIKNECYIDVEDCHTELVSDNDYVSIFIDENNTVKEYFTAALIFFSEQSESAEFIEIYKDMDMTQKIARITFGENMEFVVYMYDKNEVLETEPLNL